MENKIKVAFERQTRAVTLRPAIGRGTAVTKAKLVNGLTCEIEEGPFRLTADLSEKWGGNGQGPTPGTFGRGALASCLAMSYAMWAARLDIPIDDVEVEIQADYDTRGMCGFEEVPAGYGEIRYVVTLSSPASDEEIMRLLDTADQCSSYIDIFRREQKMKREVRIHNKENSV